MGVVELVMSGTVNFYQKWMESVGGEQGNSHNSLCHMEYAADLFLTHSAGNDRWIDFFKELLPLRLYHHLL